MSKLFLLKTMEHGILPMTDTRLHSTIMKESAETDYNWIASFKELLRVCNKKGFNQELAKDIKLAIINCYANILYTSFSYDNVDCENIENAFNVFNDVLTISKTSEEKDQRIEEVCAKFLDAFIFKQTYMSCIAFNALDMPKGSGFRNSKIQSLLEQDTIDFQSLSETIVPEYQNYREKLKKAGTDVSTFIPVDFEVATELSEEKSKQLSKKLNM